MVGLFSKMAISSSEERRAFLNLCHSRFCNSSPNEKMDEPYIEKTNQNVNHFGTNRSHNQPRNLSSPDAYPVPLNSVRGLFIHPITPKVTIIDAMGKSIYPNRNSELMKKKPGSQIRRLNPIKCFEYLRICFMYDDAQGIEQPDMRPHLLIVLIANLLHFPSLASAKNKDPGLV